MGMGGTEPVGSGDEIVASDSTCCGLSGWAAVGCSEGVSGAWGAAVAGGGAMLPSCASRVLTRCSRRIVRRRRFSTIANPAIAQTGIASASAIRTSKSSAGHHCEGFSCGYRQLETRRTTQPSSVQSLFRALVHTSAVSDPISTAARTRGAAKGRTAALSAATSRLSAGGEWTCPENAGARTAAPTRDAAMMPRTGISVSERGMRMRPCGWRSLAWSVADRVRHHSQHRTVPRRYVGLRAVFFRAPTVNMQLPLHVEHRHAPGLLQDDCS